MKQFTTIEKLDTGILYILELASSLSIILLAFGLIASMANVLTKGSVLSDNLLMQRVWAWTQCIAIDASVAGTIRPADTAGSIGGYRGNSSWPCPDGDCHH